MSSEKIKVLLVEDQIMMRLATSTALENSGKFELVAQAEDGVIGVEMAKKFEPDVILFIHTPSSLYDDSLINFQLK